MVIIDILYGTEPMVVLMSCSGSGSIFVLTLEWVHDCTDILSGSGPMVVLMCSSGSGSMYLLVAGVGPRLYGHVVSEWVHDCIDKLLVL